MFCVEMSPRRPQTPISKGFRHCLKVKTKFFDILPNLPITQDVPKNPPVKKSEIGIGREKTGEKREISGNLKNRFPVPSCPVWSRFPSRLVISRPPGVPGTPLVSNQSEGLPHASFAEWACGATVIAASQSKLARFSFYLFLFLILWGLGSWYPDRFFTVCPGPIIDIY